MPNVVHHASCWHESSHLGVAIGCDASFDVQQKDERESSSSFDDITWHMYWIVMGLEPWEWE